MMGHHTNSHRFLHNNLKQWMMIKYTYVHQPSERNHCNWLLVRLQYWQQPCLTCLSGSVSDTWIRWNFTGLPFLVGACILKSAFAHCYIHFLAQCPESNAVYEDPVSLVDLGQVCTLSRSVCVTDQNLFWSKHYLVCRRNTVSRVVGFHLFLVELSGRHVSN